MNTVIVVIHLLLALALIIVVLLQRSEGGGLGIGGGGGGGAGGMGGFLSGRGAANVLTRTTAILAACFMVTSIALTILAGGAEQGSIIDRIPESGAESSADAPAEEGGGDPDAPVVPLD